MLNLPIRCSGVWFEEAEEEEEACFSATRYLLKLWNLALEQKNPKTNKQTKKLGRVKVWFICSGQRKCWKQDWSSPFGMLGLVQTGDLIHESGYRSFKEDTWLEVGIQSCENPKCNSHKFLTRDYWLKRDPLAVGASSVLTVHVLSQSKHMSIFSNYKFAIWSFPYLCWPRQRLSTSPFCVSM